MGLILELEKPFLGLAIYIYIDEDRASVVLLADLHVVEQTFLAEITRTDGGELHKA